MPVRLGTLDAARTNMVEGESKGLEGLLLGGHYRIGPRIGEGTFGFVHRATHELLGTSFAVKILRPEFVGDPVVRRRFLDEARALSRLVHENVVPVRHVGEDGERLYLAMEWRLDLPSIGAGALIGVLWIATRPAIDTSNLDLAAGLAAMSPIAFLVWAVCRVVGTTLLVPLVEELFFRGYILRRLDRGGAGMRVVAVTVSTALFAFFHDRWLVAALAGVVFALLALRRHRTADAVLAHATANACIAAWAIGNGDWSVI